MHSTLGINFILNMNEYTQKLTLLWPTVFQVILLCVHTGSNSAISRMLFISDIALKSVVVDVMFDACKYYIKCTMFKDQKAI